MRKVIGSLWLACGLFVLVSVWALASDDEQAIELAQVPAVVRQAAAKAVPGGTFTKASKETEEGKTLYELEGKNAQGREVSVGISADAVLLEVETVIPAAEVPKVVTDALNAKLKGFKASTIERIEKPGKPASYEFHGKRADGKKAEVVISADGRTVDVEDDDEG